MSILYKFSPTLRSGQQHNNEDFASRRARKAVYLKIQSIGGKMPLKIFINSQPYIKEGKVGKWTFLGRLNSTD